jgi:tetratricopeptide (TPR) repeat protein
MRRFALLAATIWLCGCGSHPSSAPESSVSQKATDGPAASATAEPAHAQAASYLDAANTSLHELDSETQAALRQAEKLTADGKLGLAVEVLSRIIGDHPETALAFLLRGQANAQRHNDADALADFSTAVKLEPQKSTHYVARGFFQLSRGNTAKSVEDFNTALKLDPKDSRAYNDRGMARMTTGEVKQAIEDFNHALELDPKSATAYTNRSFALIKLDRRNEAVADLDRALQLDPKAPGAYDNRGVLRLEDHDYQRALADFTSAIKLEKNNPTYFSHRRETFLKLERFAEAQADASRIERLMQLEALNEAIFRNRRSPKVYLDRGEFLVDDGQIENAIENFDRALQLDPKQWRGLVGRARAWIRQGEIQKAIDDSTAALTIDPHEEAYAVRGDAYRKLGQYAKAVADYDASQRIDSEVAETWLLYSKALREAKNAKEADEALKRANELKALDAPRFGRVEPTAATARQK